MHGKMQPGRASVPSRGSGMHFKDLSGQKSEVWHVNDQPFSSEQDSCFVSENAKVRTASFLLRYDVRGFSDDSDDLTSPHFSFIYTTALTHNSITISRNSS